MTGPVSPGMDNRPSGSCGRCGERLTYALFGDGSKAWTHDAGSDRLATCTPLPYTVVPDDPHSAAPAGQAARRDPLSVGTQVRHYGTRQTARIVGHDGPYPDGSWEYQILADDSDRPRWWPDRAVTPLYPETP